MTHNNQKVAITADWHLDKQMYGIKQREIDFYEAAYKIIDTCIERGINTIINCGDVFDSMRPHRNSIRQLRLINDYLIKNKIRMICIMGNHDNVDEAWSNLFYDENNSEYGIWDITGLDVELSNGLKISGIKGFTKDAIVKEFDERIEDIKNADIIMMHCPCREFSRGHGSQVLGLDSDINDKYQLKYGVIVAVGDTHINSIIPMMTNAKNYMMCVSPGSIEMVYANEEISKYFIECEFLDEAKKKTKLQNIEIECNYKRISTRKHPIENKEQLEEFIKETFIDNSNALKDRFAVYLYYYPNTCSDAVSRIESILKGCKKDSFVRPISLVKDEDGNILSLDTLTKINNDSDTDENDQQLHYDSLTEFGEKVLNKLAMSDKGKTLLLSLLNKQIEPDFAINQYLKD